MRFRSWTARVVASAVLGIGVAGGAAAMTNAAHAINTCDDPTTAGPNVSIPQTGTDVGVTTKGTGDLLLACVEQDPVANIGIGVYNPQATGKVGVQQCNVGIVGCVPLAAYAPPAGVANPISTGSNPTGNVCAGGSCPFVLVNLGGVSLGTVYIDGIAIPITIPAGTCVQEPNGTC